MEGHGEDNGEGDLMIGDSGRNFTLENLMAKEEKLGLNAFDEAIWRVVLKTASNAVDALYVATDKISTVLAIKKMTAQKEFVVGGCANSSG